MFAMLATSPAPALVIEQMETGVYTMCELFDLAARDTRNDMSTLASDGRWLGFWKDPV